MAVLDLRAPRCGYGAHRAHNSEMAYRAQGEEHASHCGLMLRSGLSRARTPDDDPARYLKRESRRNRWQGVLRSLLHRAALPR